MGLWVSTNKLPDVCKYCRSQLLKHCLKKNRRASTKNGMHLKNKIKIGRRKGIEKKYLRNGESRAPLFLQDVKANAAIAVDIGVKHFCLE
jgi:hypothetical protein